MNSLRSKFGLLRQQLYQKVDTESLLPTKEDEYRDSESDDTIQVLQPQPSHQDKYHRRMKFSLAFFVALSILVAGAYATKRTSDRECGIQTGVYCM